MQKNIHIIAVIVANLSVLKNRRGEWKEQSSPDVIVELVKEIVQKRSDSLNIRFIEKDVLLVIDGDCLNMTVYNSDEEMCNLLKHIVASEWMFLRKGRE